MSVARITLAQLNALPAGAFISTLCGIFEHSPWVPEAALSKRPFTSIDQLHDVMTTIVDQAGETRQLALINAHPELAGKAAVRGSSRTNPRVSKAAPVSICARRKNSTDCRRLTPRIARSSDFLLSWLYAGLTATALSRISRPVCITVATSSYAKVFNRFTG